MHILKHTFHLLQLRSKMGLLTESRESHGSLLRTFLPPAYEVRSLSTEGGGGGGGGLWSQVFSGMGGGVYPLVLSLILSQVWGREGGRGSGRGGYPLVLSLVPSQVLLGGGGGGGTPARSGVPPSA